MHRGLLFHSIIDRGSNLQDQLFHQLDFLERRVVRHTEHVAFVEYHIVSVAIHSLLNELLLGDVVVLLVRDEHADEGVCQRVFNDACDLLKLGVLPDFTHYLVLRDVDDLLFHHLVVTLTTGRCVHDAFVDLLVGLISLLQLQ